MPVPGEVDIVLASELMEAGRAIQRGLVTPDRTTLIASTNRVYSMTEKTAITDGRVDSAKVIEASGAAAKTFVHGDFARIAEDTRSVISASLFGALAATAALPFRREQFEDAIRKGGVGVESSLAAFDAGFCAAAKEPTAAAKLVRTEPRRESGRVFSRWPRKSRTSFRPRAVTFYWQALSDSRIIRTSHTRPSISDRLEPIRDRGLRNSDKPILRCSTKRRATWLSGCRMKTRHELRT